MPKQNQTEWLIAHTYRFSISHPIGSGAFGEIYKGISIRTGEPVAAKVEKIKQAQPQLFYETKLYRLLQGGEGIPNVYWYGVESDCNVMVMDYLGPSLEDLFHLCERHFSLKTTCLIGDQLISRIEYLHSKNFLHRDIKPENFLIGRGKSSHIIYMIDLGLAKRYRDTRTRQHIPYRETKGITGTIRYASVNAHIGIEQSRRDDLESVVYMLLYFLKGKLPWMGIKAKTHQQKYTKIADLKMGTPIDDLCSDTPKEIAMLLRYIRVLHFESKPDYEFIQQLLRKIAEREEFLFDNVFDWTEKLPESGSFSPLMGQLKKEMEAFCDSSMSMSLSPENSKEARDRRRKRRMEQRFVEKEEAERKEMRLMTLGDVDEGSADNSEESETEDTELQKKSKIIEKAIKRAEKKKTLKIIDRERKMEAKRAKLRSKFRERASDSSIKSGMSGDSTEDHMITLRSIFEKQPKMQKKKEEADLKDKTGTEGCKPCKKEENAEKESSLDRKAMKEVKEIKKILRDKIRRMRQTEEELRQAVKKELVDSKMKKMIEEKKVSIEVVKMLTEIDSKKKEKKKADEEEGNKHPMAMKQDDAEINNGFSKTSQNSSDASLAEDEGSEEGTQIIFDEKLLELVNEKEETKNEEEDKEAMDSERRRKMHSYETFFNPLFFRKGDWQTVKIGIVSVSAAVEHWNSERGQKCPMHPIYPFESSASSFHPLIITISNPTLNKILLPTTDSLNITSSSDEHSNPKSLRDKMFIPDTSSMSLPNAEMLNVSDRKASVSVVDSINTQYSSINQLPIPIPPPPRLLCLLAMKHKLNPSSFLPNDISLTSELYPANPAFSISHHIIHSTHTSLFYEPT
ncbi:putative casein kinase I-like [Monocercomonoides exilis]|uniref:putative casein kinase I-like n=1 Tax=Monocercomonoides exilis TaxID=2049356 RepID=UPI0035596C00|nr:putative casein kinase I-like [Monocercomonoides exilis]|eukprot:MONOS_11011.1-p1 / transcript=MONOS_11011.1 / gene=MONOS_11011 / organism=Monocercomonoides_exilis_PA203 / gene_product=casein kinase I-like / transcript_product=casein kinase I-like / location=Mono_scaffold00528:15113-17671(+) / protein_length=852 / sequence_SO=supercontig / SO=protein_coding / is_pseudo=false